MTNQSDSKTPHEKMPSGAAMAGTASGMRKLDRLSLYAWLPIPLLLILIAGLWVANLQTVYESRAAMVLLNVFFTWLASLFICILTARGFLGSGQPGLLMFGCGSLLWGVTSLAAAAVVNRINPTITVHNLGALAAALCHLVGMLWLGRLTRPRRWLVVGYAGALLAAGLIFWAAMAGVTPVFFVQGQGGTPIREIVLLLAVASFAWVAWRMISKFQRQTGTFYYWYGLGLALFAVGLTGVILLSVQGGILGWTNRLTQYLGSAYLLIAAVAATRETGTRKLSLSEVDDAYLRNELLPAFQNRQYLRLVLRYGSAVVAVAAAYGLRLAVATHLGSDLPPYLMFAAPQIAVVLFAGFGPGVLAALLADMVVACWILPPVGQFYIASPVDRLGMIIYTGVSLLFCVLIELYRRSRDKAAAYDREAALRESRERLSLALASSGMATFDWDIVNDKRTWDDNVHRMLGTRPETFAGTADELFRVIHPDDRDTVQDALSKALDTGVYETEFRAVWPDGSIRRIATRGRVRYDDSGRAVRMAGVCWDVTERKQAEVALRRYEQLAEHTRDKILFVSRDDGRIFEANAAACRQYGYSREEMLTLTIQDLRAPNTRQFTLEQMALADEGGILFETVHRRKDGSSFQVEVSSHGATVDGQRTLISVIRDISERKRIEETLRESEERYRQLFQSLQEGFYLAKPIYDDSGNCRDALYLDVNPAFEHIMQRTRDQIVGKRFKELVPLIKSEWFDVFGKVTRTGEPASHQSYSDVFGQYFEAFVFCPTPGCFAVLVSDITERKRAESVLQTTLQRFYAILSGMNSGVLLVTDEGRVEYANQGFCERFNLKDSPGDLPGLASHAMIEKIRNIYLHPEEAVARIQEIVNQGQTIKGEEIAMKGGRTCLRDFVPLSIDGKSYGRLWLHTDITERKQAEEELQKLASVVQHSREFISIATPDGRMLFVNEAGAEMLGLPAEKVDQYHILQVIPDHLQDKVKNEVLVSLISEGFWEGELQYRNLETGTLMDVHATTFTIYDQDKKTPLYLANTSIDITERKRIEDALRLSEEKFARAFANNPAAIALSRLEDGMFLEVNDTWVTMNGYSREEAIGHSARQMHIWPTPEAAKCFVQTLMEKGSIHGQEQEFFRKSGETFVTELSAQLLTMRGEKVIISTLVDITERKETEQALRKTAEDLARSNKDLERFAYAASHDLQEPLRTVASFVDLLARRYQDRLDDEAREYIQFAVDGAKRMQGLIHDLLAFSRVAHAERIFTPVKIESILVEVKLSLATVIEETNAAITHGSMPEVMGNPTQLRQLLQNLIGNAIKYRKETEAPRIHIDAEQQDGQYYFSVADNGIGFDQEHAERIFTIFQRLHTHGKYKGSGVGLAICKRIVEHHDGSIWADSQTGKGSIFHFTLKAV